MKQTQIFFARLLILPGREPFLPVYLSITKQVIESFLLRRTQLSNRTVLASQIYTTMCNRMNLPVDPSTDPTQAENALVSMLKIHNQNHGVTTRK